MCSKMGYWCVLYRSVFVVVCCLLHGAHSYKSTLHHHMDSDELGYYFGVGTRLSVPEYEIVFLSPTLTVLPEVAEDGVQAEGDTSAQDAGQLNYDFTAFGRAIALRLRPNTLLIAPNIRIIRRNEMDPGEDTYLTGPIPRCHYLHRDTSMMAAISLCQDVHGFVMLENDTLEIRALTPRLHSFLLAESLEKDPRGRVPHIVRRAPLIGDHFSGDAIPILAEHQTRTSPDIFGTLRRGKRATKAKYIVETALFFDEAGYKLFSPYFKNDDNKLRDMLLAYLNGVQALYHHPSLGQPIDIVLVRMEIFKKQPSDLPHSEGERSKLLDAFCAYSQKHNPAGDANADHWDMGLYVSGLDFFAYENGRKSGVTMGLATVGGVCMDKYACVIAELGTTNAFGKPYPSAGFTSVYVLAHEMGHNLGMHHDGSGNSCPKEGYIMSPSRGTQGETLWSGCSVTVARDLSWAKCLSDSPKKPKPEMDHAKFLDEPGQAWGAKKQCEILLRDKDAHLQYPDMLKDVCQNLKCKTPHRSGFYFAGPALEGTNCGRGLICKKKRQSVTDFSTTKCKEFSKLVPDLDPTGKGLQAPHESARMWMGCAIFCRRKGTGSYYTPRLDLNDLGVDAYFPDGTWCHSEGKTNYYCLQHHCLPENFSFGKSLLGLAFGTEDVPLPQNAPPRLIPLSEDLLKYLSLGADGRPLLTTLKPGSTKPPAEEEWNDHDYLELPKLSDDFETSNTIML